MDHKVSKDMISSGMIPSGEKTQADLGRTQYGSAPSPSSLFDAYKSMYEHHKKDADGNTIPHEGEELNEGKIPAGLQAYLDKKKAGKTEDKEENGNGKNGKASKGSKPDFLDLDKDGNKTEPMKSAAKSKKSVKEGSSYGITKGSGTPSGAMAAFGKAPRMQKGAMAYDGPNKAASEAKDRVMAKAKAKRKKPTVTIDKPDSLVSMKVSKGYKESFDELVESGKFSDLELQRIIFDDFEENYRAMRNPEKYKPDDESDKPYRERSREARMKDPKRGINSPAFKKFMADRGMSV